MLVCMRERERARERRTAVTRIERDNYAENEKRPDARRAFVATATLNAIDIKARAIAALIGVNNSIAFMLNIHT